MENPEGVPVTGTCLAVPKGGQMRVELFADSNLERLQQDVNEWLEDNDPAVLQVHMSTHPQGELNLLQKTTIAIWYW